MTHSSPSSSARLEQGRVGTAVGLGHRVCRRDLAVEERLEVAGLLLIRAEVREDLGVAGVGCLAPEDRRRPPRLAEDLVEQSELQLPVALPAKLGAEVCGPQASLPHLLLQRSDDVERLGVALVVQGCRARGRGARSPPARRFRPSPAFPGTRARSRSPMPSAVPPDAVLSRAACGRRHKVRSLAHVQATVDPARSHRWCNSTPGWRGTGRR